MNTSIWIGGATLLSGWIYLILIALVYNLEDDKRDKLHLKPKPMTEPDNPSKTVTPE